MKDKILNILKKNGLYIKDKIIVLSKGEYQHFYKLLYLWGLLPAVIIVFFIQKGLPLQSFQFISIIFYLLISIYFIWHIFVIKKTLKVQPQYKVKKISKKELYKDKTKEEIKKIKQENNIDTLKKIFLIKSWNSAPMYTIVELVDILVILTQIQRIWNIIDK